MANSGQVSELQLTVSINTDTDKEDIYPFEGGNPEYIANNGMLKLGGIVPVYEKESTFPDGTGSYLYTQNGQLLESIDAGSDIQTVKSDGQTLAQVSGYGVESKVALKGYDDCALTADGTILAIKLNGAVVTVYELSLLGVVLNSRTINFTGIAGFTQFFTSISIINYQPMHYADSQEFALRLGAQVVVIKESSPGTTLVQSIESVGILGGAVINNAGAIVFGSYLVVFGDSGRIASFDGANWKNYDGTGNGAGPYRDGFLGGDNILCAEVFKGALVLGGATNGRIGSYDGITWTDYNALSGLHTNGGALGATSVTAMAAYSSTYLFVGGSTGRVATWDGSNWKNYDATGTGLGPNSNAAVLGANQVNSMILFSGTKMVVAGAAGRLGSWDGTNWKNSDGTGTGTGPFSTATVIGAVAINSLAILGAILFIAGASGRVGTFDGTNFRNYDGTGTGTGPSSNGVVVGAITIVKVFAFGTTMVVLSGTSVVGSWDGSAWKNSDGTGTGTGIFNSGASMGNIATVSGLVYSGYAVLLTKNYGANNITSANVIGPWYTGDIGQIMDGMTTKSYLYCFRYETNGFYLFCLVGNNLNRASVVSLAGVNTATKSLGNYVWPQTSGGKTRHLVTETPQVVGGNINVVETLGWYDFSSFRAFTTPIFTANNALAIVFECHGFGYSDIVYQPTGTTTDRYNVLAPIPVKTPALAAQVTKGNTNTLIAGHGKLSNAFGLPTTKPFEFRTNWTTVLGQGSAVQSYLSVAVVDSINADAMGVTLTDVGSFDPTYQPSVRDDDKILFAYNGVFYCIKIGKTIPQRWQKISDQLYKLNTIHPLNVYDSLTKTLSGGSLDYNGKMIYSATAVPSAVNTKVAAQITQPFSNGVDPGPKLVQITAPTQANLQPFGLRIPLTGGLYPNYRVDVFVADAYSFSTYNDGGSAVLPAPPVSIYVAQSVIPVPMGSVYYQSVAQMLASTAFLVSNYDGFQNGNEQVGQAQSFGLFGQSYLFDGLNLYQANFTNGILTSLTLLCSASGMSLIASSPTEAFFLSAFDNSLYSFNGGRSLTKVKNFAAVPSIIRGVFNLFENTLLLETAASFIWVRDGLATQNLKKANQTALNLFSTGAGIIIGNPTQSWQYSYQPLSGSAVVPLSVTFPYLGMTHGTRAIVTAWLIMIYNPAKTQTIVKVSELSRDQDAQYLPAQPETFNLTPDKFDSGGYAWIRKQPQYQRSLGSTIKVDISTWAAIFEVDAIYEPETVAVIAASKSQ